MKTIAVQALIDLMRSETPHALFDVREIGEAEAGHILGATFLPRRMIEFRIADLVPVRATTIVVYDEGGKRAERAAATLRQLGYTDVAVLGGGAAAWRQAGKALTEGSNVPSKLFGEHVHDQDHTPSVNATTLRGWQRDNAKFLVCDIRTPEEYARSRIPGAFSTPGFDVGLCMPDLKDRSVPVVVNCAGRTRSIIACETLRHLGMENVYALENGTMGWVLSDGTLEKGGGQGLIEPSVAGRAAAHGRALKMAQSVGAAFVDPAQIRQWLAERDQGQSNVYFFDVRQTVEYDSGHIDGFTILPGALAIQRTDEFMPVRQTQVVFVDDDETRALIAAYWLRRSGFPKVAVLKGGVGAWTDAGFGLTKARQRRAPLGLAEEGAQITPVRAQDAAQLVNSGTRVIHVDTSTEFAKRHLAGASWLPRGWLEDRIASLVPDRGQPLLVTCRDGQQSLLAALALKRLGYRDVAVLAGGMAAADGLAVEQGPDPSAGEPKDFILPPYAKGVAGMQRYLEWETKLTRAQT